MLITGPTFLEQMNNGSSNSETHQKAAKTTWGAAQPFPVFIYLGDIVNAARKDPANIKWASKKIYLQGVTKGCPN